MKYHNRKTGGYDSNKEAMRACELRLLEKAGKIRNLVEQERFEVISRQVDSDGKTVERPVFYVADFAYYDANTMEYIVEDTKGFRTKDYIIKRKLMLQRYGIRIREI